MLPMNTDSVVNQPFSHFPFRHVFFSLFSVSDNQCWQFNGEVKMRSHFSLTVVLVSRSDESWRSDDFTGTGSAPLKPRKTGSERGRIRGGGGGLWLSDGLTACTDIKEEPEIFGQCRIWWLCVNKQEEKVRPLTFCAVPEIQNWN